MDCQPAGRSAKDGSRVNSLRTCFQLGPTLVALRKPLSLRFIQVFDILLRRFGPLQRLFREMRRVHFANSLIKSEGTTTTSSASPPQACMKWRCKYSRRAPPRVKGEGVSVFFPVGRCLVVKTTSFARKISRHRFVGHCKFVR